jgi:diguanylate cyclase (GGDEF)-like protein
MPNRKNDELPLDIYIPFVQTLFRDGVTLALGLGVQTLLASMVYWKTGEPIYLGVAMALLVIGAVRMWSIRKYRDLPAPVTREDARHRENVYVALGTLQALALGTFCFAGIYAAPDPYGEVAALAITLGTATSIAGRNYGSPRMVMILIVCLAGPISLGFLMRGDVYHVVLGLMSTVFFIAIRKYAENVRDVLFAALAEEKKANRLAQRFDRALNTMSSSLIMLSAEGRVVVANAEAARLMGAGDPKHLLGRTLRGLLMRGVAGGMLSPKDFRYAETQLTRALREGRNRKVLLRLTDGRHIEFSAREGHDELGVITAEDVTARIEQDERIRAMARFDSLTGLPNRAYFHELVSDFIASGDPARNCGLVVFDLDDFKSVNDTLGHPIGDGLICAVAERLAVHASEHVKISRFGGDEFMIYFDRLKDEAEFEQILSGVFANLQGDIDVAGHALRIQASAGAVMAPVRSADVDTMTVKADLALYKAKEDGKNGWRIFESVMDIAFRNRQAMKVDLRQAVETGGLRVVYQPIVALETMRIASCEALCRWDHPELGPISPAVFIPLAEEMGIISDISSFMLGAATRECVKWPAEVSVSVNLSAKDFRSQEIVDKVKSALKEADLAPERLEIEVTETALLDDRSSVRLYIEELKQLGVKIALDDFGTGYSSLSYLHTLPLDKVKIDRSFLEDIDRNRRSLELLKGVVNLSRPLGLSVTIEGVETYEQLRLLTHEVRPDLVQGFLFGSALSAAGIETMSSTTWPFGDKLNKARLVTSK